MKTFGADKRDCCEPLESQGLKGANEFISEQIGSLPIRA